MKTLAFLIDEGNKNDRLSFALSIIGCLFFWRAAFVAKSQRRTTWVSGLLCFKDHSDSRFISA